MSEERLKVDVALEKLTRLEKWIEQINDAVCRHGIHVTCQADENRKISRRVDELEELLLNHQKIGEEWIKLFKKLNADRMMEDVALKHRQDILEKKLLEPIAQRLVDQGRAYFTVPASRHFCERCDCHKDK